MTRLYAILVAGLRFRRAEDGDVLYRAAKGSLRSLRTWFLPGLGLLIATIIPLTLFSSQDAGSPDSGLILMYFYGRIVIVDYLIFGIAWLCGWEAASRFRRAPERLEELIMTPLQPKGIGAYFMGGGPLVWFYGLMGFAIIEGTLFASLFVAQLAGTNNPTAMVFLAALTAVPSLLVFPLMALFQLETVRIAYWMFARAAIIRTSLLRIALVNLFVIPIYVFGLTMIGIFVTIFSFIGVSAIGGDSFFGIQPAWGTKLLMLPLACAAPIPGLLLVLLLKRAIAYAYSLTFEQSLLYHTWWGASERDHPASYPRHYHDHYLKWRVWMVKNNETLTPPEPPRPLATFPDR